MNMTMPAPLRPDGQVPGTSRTNLVVDEPDHLIETSHLMWNTPVWSTTTAYIWTNVQPKPATPKSFAMLLGEPPPSIYHKEPADPYIRGYLDGLKTSGALALQGNVFYYHVRPPVTPEQKQFQAGYYQALSNCKALDSLVRFATFVHYMGRLPYRAKRP